MFIYALYQMCGKNRCIIMYYANIFIHDNYRKETHGLQPWEELRLFLFC